MAEGYFLPPINLTMIEAFNVYLASRLLQKYSHLYNPGLASTLLKLETIIPKPLKQKIRNSIEYLERQPKDEHKIKNLNILVQAWLSNHRVEILYQALSAKDPEAYIIEPYFIEPILTGRSIYVIAYCHQKNSILAFNLDRIVGKIIVQEDTYEIPPESYEIAPSFNTIEHIDSEWGIDQDEQLINVKLHFKPTVSKYILAAAWHPSQKVSLNHDGSAIATFRVRNTVDFRSWVLGWSDDVEVLEPETFRKQIIDIARALMSNYGLL